MKNIFSKVGIGLLLILVVGLGVSLAVRGQRDVASDNSNREQFAHLNGTWQVQHQDWWIQGGDNMLTFGTLEIVNGFSQSTDIDNFETGHGNRFNDIRGYSARMQIVVMDGDMHFVEFDADTGHWTNGQIRLRYDPETGDIVTANPEMWTGIPNQHIIRLTRV